MWAGEARAIAANARFRFLGLRAGQPTIYERFLANVARAGLRGTVRQNGQTFPGSQPHAAAEAGAKPCHGDDTDGGYHRMCMCLYMYM